MTRGTGIAVVISTKQQPPPHHEAANVSHLKAASSQSDCNLHPHDSTASATAAGSGASETKRIVQLEKEPEDMMLCESSDQQHPPRPHVNASHDSRHDLLTHPAARSSCSGREQDGRANDSSQQQTVDRDEGTNSLLCPDHEKGKLLQALIQSLDSTSSAQLSKDPTAASFARQGKWEEDVRAKEEVGKTGKEEEEERERPSFPSSCEGKLDHFPDHGIHLPGQDYEDQGKLFVTSNTDPHDNVKDCYGEEEEDDYDASLFPVIHCLNPVSERGGGGGSFASCLAPGCSSAGSVGMSNGCSRSGLLVPKVMKHPAATLCPSSPSCSAAVKVAGVCEDHLLLSTVIEEEPDSLEEFIKHETECGCKLPDGSLHQDQQNHRNHKKEEEEVKSMKQERNDAASASGVDHKRRVGSASSSPSHSLSFQASSSSTSSSTFAGSFITEATAAAGPASAAIVGNQTILQQTPAGSVFLSSSQSSSSSSPSSSSSATPAVVNSPAGRKKSAGGQDRVVSSGEYEGSGCNFTHDQEGEEEEAEKKEGEGEKESAKVSEARKEVDVNPCETDSFDRYNVSESLCLQKVLEKGGGIGDAGIENGSERDEAVADVNDSNNNINNHNKLPTIRVGISSPSSPRNIKHQEKKQRQQEASSSVALPLQEQEQHQNPQKVTGIEGAEMTVTSVIQSPSSTSSVAKNVPVARKSKTSTTTPGNKSSETSVFSREFLLSEIENFSRDKLKGNNISKVEHSHDDQLDGNQIHNPLDSATTPPATVVPTAEVRIADLVDTEAAVPHSEVREGEVDQNADSLTCSPDPDHDGNNLRHHFLPPEAKSFLMRSPLPDTDVVTTLCFETIEVRAEDDDASDSGNSSDNNKLCNTGPSSPTDKMDMILLTVAADAGDPTKNECNKKLASNPAAATASSGCVKDVIERHRKTLNGSSSNNIMNANQNLANIGLNGFKRSGSIKDLRDNKNEAEVRIAKEIIELKQREEELKAMRQEMMRLKAKQQQQMIQHQQDPANTSCSDVSSVEIEGRCSPSNSEISTTESISGRISVDSFESGSSGTAVRTEQTVRDLVSKLGSTTAADAEVGKGKACAPRSIRSMKPYEELIKDQNTVSSKSSNHPTESPIEREIRLAKERDDELRKEKERITEELMHQSRSASVSQSGDSAETVMNAPAESSGITRTPVAIESGSGSSKKMPAATTGSIQKVLATTRIQQEIEEQTQREMALKASGSIMTISQERTDLKVTTNLAQSTRIQSHAAPDSTPSSSSSLLASSASSGTSSNLLKERASQSENGDEDRGVETTTAVAPVKLGNQTSASNVNSGNNCKSNSSILLQTQQLQSNPLPTPLSSSSSSPSTTGSKNASCLSTSSPTSSSISSSSSSASAACPPMQQPPQQQQQSSLMPSVNSIKMGFLNHYQKNVQLGSGISMHRFISSKGKSSSSTGLSRFASHQNLCFNASSNDFTQSFSDLRTTKNSASGIMETKESFAMNSSLFPSPGSSNSRIRKGSISAETKIQEELREMRAREEELKHQRVMARSQGNLTILVPDDDDAAAAVSSEGRSSSVVQHSTPSAAAAPPVKKAIVVEKITIQRTKSNPHLAKSAKGCFPPNDHPDNNSNNNHDNRISDQEEEAGATAGGEGEEDEHAEEQQVNLTQLLGRKIRSSLIAQWESKIQQEIQSTS